MDGSGSNAATCSIGWTKLILVSQGLFALKRNVVNEDPLVLTNCLTLQWVS